MRLDAESIRERLSFSVQGLRRAAARTEAIDSGVARLRRVLERRTWALTDAALERDPSESGGLSVRIQYAQAQAVAELARKAALQDIFRSEGRLGLIASMAVSRWIAALRALNLAPASERVLRGHVDAGRLAHRMLVALRKRDGLRSGCGQLASTVVVAEFVHAANLSFVEELIEEGLDRGRTLASEVSSEEMAVLAVSRAYAAGAALLHRVADEAEPALAELLTRAITVERDVEDGLLHPGSRRKL